MKDTSIPARRVEYNRYSTKTIAPRQQVVRVFRLMPERVTLQLRNQTHYMTATLDARQATEIITALTAGVMEIEPEHWWCETCKVAWNQGPKCPQCGSELERRGAD